MHDCGHYEDVYITCGKATAYLNFLMESLYNFMLRSFIDIIIKAYTIKLYISKVPYYLPEFLEVGVWYTMVHDVLPIVCVLHL